MCLYVNFWELRMPKKADDDTLNSLPQGAYTDIETPEQLQNAFRILTEQFNMYGRIQIQMRHKDLKIRSLKQNNSLHKLCQDIADIFNSYGITPKEFFRHGYEIVWTMDMVKRNIFCPVLKVLTGNDKTSKAKKADLVQVYDVINKRLGEEYGIHVEWMSY